MKHIGIISEHASPLVAPGSVDSGGQNIYVSQLAAHLAAKGYRIDVFTRRDAPDLEPVVIGRHGVRIIHVPAGPARYLPKEELLPYMEQFAEHMLGFMGRSDRYDLIHANFWMSGLVAAHIKRALGTPFVITFHALGRVRRMHQGAADAFPVERLAIEDRIIRECDGIIAECPQDKQDLMTLYRADSEKIIVVPCGFDPAELMPVNKLTARLMLGFAAAAPLVLQLGRILPRKGIETAIRGFAGFVKKYSRAAMMAIVGGASKSADPARDPELQRLMHIAREEGIASNIVFRGRADRSELKYFYSAADVFVTTPWYEPFGITPLESMACETPVIGANVGGIKYSVMDGATGLLVKANSAPDVCAALIRLFSAPGLLETMGKNAIKRVHALFTWEKVVAAIIPYFQQVAAHAALRAQQPTPDLLSSVSSVLGDKEPLGEMI